MTGNKIWRLGADLGANSLCWAAIELDAPVNGNPIAILATGSRIFSDGRDPKSGASLAADRRDARAMRRRRDRFQQRQKALIKYLIADGLFPADEAERKAMAAIDYYRSEIAVQQQWLVGLADTHLTSFSIRCPRCPQIGRA